ncbi:MAG TPA: Yip1 family protein [Burkholderiales bacterium]|nr:Yip1 family protein [Burkholderiales bacterium]
MPRIIRIVLAPRDEWARIAAERSHGALIHGLALPLLPALASFAMARNSDLPLPEHAVAATYLAGVLTIFAIAAAFWLLARFDSRDATLGRCIQVAAYGATPVLLASVLLFTPVLVIVCVLALPYVFYLYYLGVQQVLRVPSHEAAQFVAIAIVAALVASTLGGAGAGALALL